MFQTQKRVEFRDTDTAGIMHFTGFFGWMEEVEHEALRSVGLSVVIPTDDGKISWPRVSANCDFVSPVRFEDNVDIKLRLQKLGEKSAQYNFEISCDERLIATGSLTSVCCLVANQQVESISIPDWIREKLENLK